MNQGDADYTPIARACKPHLFTREKSGDSLPSRPGAIQTIASCGYETPEARELMRGEPLRDKQESDSRKRSVSHAVSGALPVGAQAQSATAKFLPGPSPATAQVVPSLPHRLRRFKAAGRNTWLCVAAEARGPDGGDSETAGGRKAQMERKADARPPKCSG
jgi:hypothetical protein